LVSNLIFSGGFHIDRALPVASLRQRSFERKVSAMDTVAAPTTSATPRAGAWCKGAGKGSAEALRGSLTPPPKFRDFMGLHGGHRLNLPTTRRSSISPYRLWPDNRAVAFGLAERTIRLLPNFDLLKQLH
jgi:hypothetical protein